MSAPVRSVLVVDDDDNLRRTLLEYAASVGSEAWGASNGLEALWAVRQRHPDLVLLDLGMPRLDGFETVRHIRKHAPSTRIVVITGDREEATRGRVASLGLELLLKPLSLPALEAVFVPREAADSPARH